MTKSAIRHNRPEQRVFSTAVVSDGLVDGYLTPAQLSKRLGVAERTLYRWHSAGKGPPRIRIGHVVLYRADAVRDWLAANETRSAERPRGRQG